MTLSLLADISLYLAGGAVLLAAAWFVIWVNGQERKT
jgi:hypothetical protein